MTKRYGHLYRKIYDINNIELADDKARRNKHNYGIERHDKNRKEENIKLSNGLKNHTYKTSSYFKFHIFEPKKRIIFRLPYYPDRITHHAIMNIMEPIWVNNFIRDTYSCIKTRGIHDLNKRLSKILRKHPEATKYCLKLDIRKFYPSINHDILLILIRHIIKDNELIFLFREIIESADGVPIGNYLSQFFANYYLSNFDHWIKENVKVKYYFRYADDIVIFNSDKQFLHNLLIAIKFYIKSIKLDIKPNYQIINVEKEGIDFVGYKFYHTHVLIRKSIKMKIKRIIHLYKTKRLSKDKLKRKLISYFGWLKYCNSKHFLQYIQKETGIHFSNWNAKVVKISNWYNTHIYVFDVIVYSNRFRIDFVYNNQSYSMYSKSKQLLDTLIRTNIPTRLYIRKRKKKCLL